MRALKKLQKTVETLRGPQGCMWDKKQTLKSLMPMLIEEVYELDEAVTKNSFSKISEEIGDVLMILFMLCQIGKEKNKFGLDDAALGITEKLIERHPHVFGNVKVKDEKEIIKNWNKIKGKKNLSRKQDEFDIPSSMPALLKARRIKEKAGISVGKIKSAPINSAKAGEYLFNAAALLAEKGVDAENELNRYCAQMLKKIRKPKK